MKIIEPYAELIDNVDGDDDRELPNPDEVLIAMDLKDGNLVGFRVLRKFYKKTTT